MKVFEKLKEEIRQSTKSFSDKEMFGIDFFAFT